jgi:tetratricopeptide (TPR) repeat protein
MTRPPVFIGSSSEGKTIAQYIRAQLKDDAEITIWYEGVFRNGHGYLESLFEALDKFDFAILVWTPDDMTQSREQTSQSARDNVLFECGLFMGRLGRNRTFVVYDADKGIKIPSDLSGVTLATYRGARKDKNLMAAVGEACDRICAVIKEQTELKGDNKAALESYTILTNILLEMLSESGSARQLGDLISGASARQLQRFSSKYTEEMPPEDWDIELLRNVGIILRRKVSNEAAIAVFRLLKEHVPQDREILDELGYTLLKAGVQKDAEEAEQIYRALVRSFGWRHFHHRHGVASAALDRFDDAIHDLETALSMEYGKRDPKMLDTREYPQLQRLKTERSIDFTRLLSHLETQIPTRRE